MKKKVVNVLLVLFMITCVSACNEKEDVNQDSLKDTSNAGVQEEVKDSDKLETNLPLNGIRPEVKEAIDSYEAFFDEYVTFMNEYTNSDNALEMMADYTKFMAKYTETMKKMDAMENEELSDEETIYLIEAQNRINVKLLQIQ